MLIGNFGLGKRIGHTSRIVDIIGTFILMSIKNAYVHARSQIIGNHVFSHYRNSRIVYGVLIGRYDRFTPERVITVIGIPIK